jgi:predicted AlkP superfamily phosphohydrolase/phosphomutase
MSSSREVAVFGLDGVPFSLLQRLFDKGVMPCMRDMARTGTFVCMETAVPPVSSVAWASFMTGENPGEHGIFGFTDLKDNQISLRFPSFDDIGCPTIWRRIEPKTSVVVNLPFTYPARPLKGVLVAGFVAPVLERSVFPEALIPWLRSRNYRTDVDAVKGREDRRSLLKDLFETLTTLEEVMLSLMEAEPWDLFVGVVTGTDRLNHFLLDAADDPGHPFHEDFMAYYRRVDALFGRFVSRLGLSTRLIALSDHGFTRLKTEISLGFILKSLGHLSFTRADPILPDHIHPLSRAFPMEPTRIYLNTGERFENGVLNPSEALALRAQLKNDLERMTLLDVGIRDLEGGDPAESPLFSAVKCREEVFSGQYERLAPDLVVIPRPGYDVKATVNGGSPTRTDIFTGMHTYDDAFLLVNDPAVAPDLNKPSITDATRLALDRLL